MFFSGLIPFSLSFVLKGLKGLIRCFVLPVFGLLKACASASRSASPVYSFRVYSIVIVNDVVVSSCVYLLVVS